MNILNQYQLFINRIINIRLIFLLIGLILLINLFIFPIFNTQRVKLLDTRFYYSPKEAAEYDLQLEENEKINSLILHGTVDLLYPVIYTLLLGCIIFYLKGNIKLLFLPIAVFFTDFMENLFIILILYLSKQNFFYTTYTMGASIMTPLKWCFIALSLCVVIYLALRRIYEK